MPDRVSTAYSVGHPLLRTLDGHTIVYEGMNYLYLRDPLALSGKTLLVPQPLIPILPLMDGTRDLRGLQVALAVRFSVRASVEELAHFVQSLDEVLFLDNQHYREERAARLAEYRQTGCRPSAEAGQSYPQDPRALHAMIETYLSAVPSRSEGENNHAALRGIICPHIDYERGGHVYAQIWQRAAESIRQAELVIILGTDHFSEGIPISLTRQNYCTPLGRLEVDQEAFIPLVSILGETGAFKGELHHRSEHSIELAAVWMQHILGDHPKKFLPILCGPINQFEDESGSPAKNPWIDQFLERLGETIQSRRTFVIAAGDLAHVGPAFGGERLTPGDLLRLHEDDHFLIESIVHGNADEFYQKIHATTDHNNICGTTPIYLALRLLGPCSGETLAYAACPADIENTSYVTISGIALI